MNDRCVQVKKENFLFDRKEANATMHQVNRANNRRIDKQTPNDNGKVQELDCG